MNSTTKLVIIWIAGLFLLVALSSYFPRLAVWCAVLLLVDVTMVNSSTIASYLNTNTTGN
jgi:hypothetical protein